MSNKEIPKSEPDFNTFFEHARKRIVDYLRRNYKLSKADIDDVYQDSCMALFKNIKDGKLVTLTSSLMTYFSSICVFQALKKMRDTKFVEPVREGQYNQEKIDKILDLDGGFTVKQQQAMEDIISNMPPPCNTILWSYYYDNLSMEEIARRIKYKNSDSVKTKKSQCMSKLKKTFTDKIKDIVYGE